ncbi:MAG: hypothetical protein HOE90_05735 [Bacteriovoracaceae bacterium]|jgi:hypothetical protein|nr:hypothetical protein [Bacteriovoracaceae bacterium]
MKALLLSFVLFVFCIGAHAGCKTSKFSKKSSQITVVAKVGGEKISYKCDLKKDKDFGHARAEKALKGGLTLELTCSKDRDTKIHLSIIGLTKKQDVAGLNSFADMRKPPYATLRFYHGKRKYYQKSMDPKNTELMVTLESADLSVANKTAYLKGCATSKWSDKSRLNINFNVHI